MRGWAREVAQILELRLRRGELAAREGAVSALVGLWLGIALLTGTVVACILFVVGLAGAATALFGGAEWTGELAVGAAWIVACLAGFAVLRRRMRQRVVERARERFGEPSPEDRP